MITTFEPGITTLTRDEQIERLAAASFDGYPVLVHGSLAHAAVRSCTLPVEIRFSGEARDIDVFAQGLGSKAVIEEVMVMGGLADPAPIDAGLRDLLIGEPYDRAACKHGICVQLDDSEGVFEEVKDYEVIGTDGMMLRSFSPQGLLAVHRLEPYDRLGPTHRIMDGRFEAWCESNGIVLPGNLDKSIKEFHRAYREKYPYGRVLKYAAAVYANTLPEGFRSRFRHRTHRLMEIYTGRGA